jgi:hypothetical protein
MRGEVATLASDIPMGFVRKVDNSYLYQGFNILRELRIDLLTFLGSLNRAYGTRRLTRKAGRFGLNYA